MINQEKIREIKGKLSDPQWGAKETNAGLWLDRYIEEQSRDDPTSRQKLVEQVAGLAEPNAYNRYFERWQKILKEEYGAQVRKACVKGRMVVGLGSESVLETSICLHRIYGVPYIPGSALKGLAASYAHQRLGGEWQKKGKLYNIVFGNTDEAGYITFFDALYKPGSGYRGQALYPDVITVHHQKYYQGEDKAPADSDDPKPVPFLSATGIYLFALAAPDLQETTRWLDITFLILAEALKTYGIGAKTSSGYGRMEFIDSPARSIAPAARPSMSSAYIRPNISRFSNGQEISGRVINPTDELRRRAPEAKAFLQFREFPAKDVLIIVEAEEAASWTPGQPKNCLFVREEEREGCTVLICRPGATGGGKKKKKHSS